MTAVQIFESQVRSRERVRALAEVYTHEREVNAMLDLVADMFPCDDDPGNIDRTFLEPACGHGNFLVAIVARKIAQVTVERYGEGTEFEYRLLRCFTSTYGIDIDDDNVFEARGRMHEVVEEHIRNTHVTVSEGFLDALHAVLGTNVQRADTLADAERIEVVEYKPVGDGCFLREWSNLDQGEPDLFSPESLRDSHPVHYSELGDNPNPVMKPDVR